MSRHGMLDFSLTEEQRAIIATTRTFVERELSPHEEEVERTGVLAPELVAEISAKAIDLGLYAANMPEEVGGAGLDTVTWVLYEKELGRAGYALQSSCVGAAVEHPAGRHGGPEGEVPPPERARGTARLPRHDGARAGSDLRGMRTRAVREADGGGSRAPSTSSATPASPTSSSCSRGPRTRRRGRRCPRSSWTWTPRGRGPRRLPQRLAPRLHQLDHRLRLLGRPRTRCSARRAGACELAGTWLGSTRLQVAAVVPGPGRAGTRPRRPACGGAGAVRADDRPLPGHLVQARRHGARAPGGRAADALGGVEGRPGRRRPTPTSRWPSSRPARCWRWSPTRRSRCTAAWG